MKPHGDTPAFSNMLLTACILLAQIDMHGLLDYALKAGLGGAIWLAYKLIGDKVDRNRKIKDAGPSATSHSRQYSNE